MQSGGGATILYVLAGNYEAKLAGGYGVTLEIASQPNGAVLKEGFAAADVDVVTFTVCKSVDFSYTSNGRVKGQTVRGLTIEKAAGRLKGSFESSISGLVGKHDARVEFDVPFPS